MLIGFIINNTDVNQLIAALHVKAFICLIILKLVKFNHFWASLPKTSRK